MSMTSRFSRIWSTVSTIKERKEIEIVRIHHISWDTLGTTQQSQHLHSSSFHPEESCVNTECGFIILLSSQKLCIQQRRKDRMRHNTQRRISFCWHDSTANDRSQQVHVRWNCMKQLISTHNKSNFFVPASFLHLHHSFHCGLRGRRRLTISPFLISSYKT